VEKWISLPYGGKGAGFDAQDLVKHIAESGRDYIIQGQQKLSFSAHTKPHSLDYWLREGHPSKEDMKLADNAVVEQLEKKTDLFVVDYGLTCPDSGQKCKGLRLTQAGKNLATAKGWWVNNQR